MSISVPVMAGKWRFDMSKLLDYAALHDRGIRYSKPASLAALDCRQISQANKVERQPQCVAGIRH
jgi:hypothetical protein